MNSPKPNHYLLRRLALVIPLILLGALFFIHSDEHEKTSERSFVENPATPSLASGKQEPSPVPARQLVASNRKAELEAKASVGPNLPLNFLDHQVTGNRVAFTLPDMGELMGEIKSSSRDESGIVHVEGRVMQPFPGKFFIQRQTREGLAGPFFGNVRFDGQQTAWRIEPTPDLKHARFVRRKVSDVVCVKPVRPETIAAAAKNYLYAPQTHPTAIPHANPPNESIVPLQSLPGAAAVLYLDFDGEQGPFYGWGDRGFSYAPPQNRTTAEVFDIWRMVAEDFQGFNINVTTDRRAYDQAAPGSRNQIVITVNLGPGNSDHGGASLGSYNAAPSLVSWVFGVWDTKTTADVISHEFGHSLGLNHQGRTIPVEEYYTGHGDGETGWAPIMGLGYLKSVSHWTKGDYLNANAVQDDLAVLATNNNNVAYRTDDHGSSHAAATYLEIQPNNSVLNEGILERTGDADAFRFSTTGGTTSLAVSTVSLNPNLDLLVDIVNVSTNTVVATANPPASLNATITANLLAGEYLLLVRGTGLGDPVNSGLGYTNYGCIGSYFISGSVAGGIKPDRFSVAEHSPNGTTVGSVAARLNHGSNSLSWAINSGNASGAFAINPATGAITVANPSVLNYETLSTRWDDPATLELFIGITDATSPTLDETIRAVVTVTDVNEAPTAPAVSVTMLERTVLGTPIATVVGADVDRFDKVTYAITSGNTGGVFAIDAMTGVVQVASTIEVAANTTYNLTVTLTDVGTPVRSTNVSVTVNVINIVAGYQPGAIVRTYFENITGTTVASLTGNAKFPNNPDSQEYLSSFDGGQHGENFGSTIRGYLIPPTTGTYRFWIASDDASQLRFTTTTNPALAVSIASVSNYTGNYDWTANSSQQSITFNLTAGQAYYIEARHKEGSGGDHVAVAWTGPGITTRQVIPSLFLAPYYQNYAPKITATTFSLRENSITGQTVGIVPVTDVNTSDTFSAYTITAGNSSGIFGIEPATGRLFVANGSLLSASTNHTLTIQTTDSGTPPLNGTGAITVNVLPAGTISLAGIHREIWTGIPGGDVPSLTGNTNYPFRPSARVILSSFASNADYGDSFGSRIRATFIPPTSGDYRFYIASDDNSRLLFSANPSGAGATQIASVPDWTGIEEWTKFPSQTSSVRTLVAGQAVYLEALHKEAGGGDHVSVGYTGPGVTTPTVIPGSMLQPFDINAAPVFSQATFNFALNSATATVGQTVGVATATEPNQEPLIFAILSGNSAGAFAIHPTTGTVTIANPAVLTSGSITTLQVITQDGGLGAAYPLKSATATVNIRVSDGNFISTVPPQIIAEDTTTGALNFSLNTAVADYPSFIVTGSSSNTALAPNANIVFSGTGVNRTVTVTPTPGINGTATITLTVSDGTFTASSNFLLTVVNASDPLVTAGSTWKYLDTGANPGATWMQNDFADSAWPGGPAMLGFGDLNGQAPTTLVNSTSSRITTYFRHTFNVANPRQYADLTLRLMRDDGAVVWLNGVEVHRSNMAAAPALITASTQAFTPVGGVDENTFFNTTLDARELRTGTNVIAVEVHQFGTASTDLGFDLSLDAALDIPAPLIAAGATWKYRDTGIAPPANWTSNAYADTAWTSGPARLGYGDTQATTVAYGADVNNRHITTWFRHTFTVADAALFDALRLELQRDDGAVVYLNGVELLRDNLPSSSVAPTTLATASVGGADETAWNIFTVPATALITGANTVAIELHQSAPDSNDLGLDVRLFGLRQTASTFADWQAAQFGSDKTNAALAGPLTDLDKDGINTLLEYAFASDPRSANQDALPTLATASGKLALQFERNAAATDITLTVQAADTLTGPWLNLATSTAGNPFALTTPGTTILEATTGPLRSVEVRDVYLLTDPAHPRRFMRLQLTQP